jgi:hypothetical protein
VCELCVSLLDGPAAAAAAAAGDKDAMEFLIEDDRWAGSLSESDSVFEFRAAIGSYESEDPTAAAAA